MATYICPKCNIETAEPKQHAGHKPERKRSVALSVPAGIGFSVFFFLFFHYMMPFVYSFTDVDSPDWWLWIFAIVFLLLGTLTVTWSGIRAIRRGTKYRRSPEPTAKLAPQNHAFGWTLIAMSCAWIIFRTIEMMIPVFYATRVKHP